METPTLDYSKEVTTEPQVTETQGKPTLKSRIKAYFQKMDEEDEDEKTTEENEEAQYYRLKANLEGFSRLIRAATVVALIGSLLISADVSLSANGFLENGSFSLPDKFYLAEIILCFIVPFLLMMLFWAFVLSLANLGGISLRQRIRKYELSHAQDKVEEDLFRNSINMSYTYLNEYYGQTKAQAESGFIVTVAVAIFGALLISLGVLLLFFGDNEKITPAYITCASGVITEFISSIFFALYNKTITSMNSYHDKLVLSQNVAFALRIAGEIDGMGEKNKAKLAIINELVKDVNAQMMKSDGDADEPPKKDKPSASDAETPS